MPYQNEHAARVQNPGKFKTIRRINDKFGAGIDAIFGKKTDDSPMELQAVRFDKDKYTPGEAKDWMKDHDIKYQEFEEAKDGDDDKEDSKDDDKEKDDKEEDKK